jgi:hypothetical protein
MTFKLPLYHPSFFLDHLTNLHTICKQIIFQTVSTIYRYYVHEQKFYYTFFFYLYEGGESQWLFCSTITVKPVLRGHLWNKDKVVL